MWVKACNEVKCVIISETRNVKIYYTINGTKPDPFPRAGAARCTMEYQGPFTLPAGKQTVKAVAMTA